MDGFLKLTEKYTHKELTHKWRFRESIMHIYTSNNLSDVLFTLKIYVALCSNNMKDHVNIKQFTLFEQTE